MPRFPREGRSSHPCFAGFASSTSRRHDEHQSLLEAQQTSGSFTSSFSREKKNDLDDLDDDDFDDDDLDDETTHATPNTFNTNGVSHQSARVYLKNLLVVACMMMMCTLATCVGIASAYRPSRTGMVGRRDVHPNKNVHVVTESFNDVKESNMVIDDYIEKKKEKMVRERERLEEMSEKETTTTTQTKTGKSASSSTKKGKDHHSKSSRKRNKTLLTRANENGFEQHEHNQHQPSTKDPVTPTTTTTTTTTTTAAAAIVENITPKTLLETVRDVKHVREAEKKAKENGGSFAVIAGIGNSSAASPSHSTLSSNIKGDIDDNDNTDEKVNPVAAAIVPGSVAVLGPQTSVKNSIESIELISNATSQNAQSWGIEDEEDEEDEGQSEATTTTTTTTTGRRGKSARKKKDQRSSQQP